MPKVSPIKGRAKASRTTPLPAEKPAPNAPKAKSVTKARDPTHSHLYTDDNPSTTIHGTGFKDAAAAHRTLELIARRSLTYQFQTVNTMYHRAKHHPAMKRKREGADKASQDGNADDAVDSTAGMQAAMDVFSEWLDVTYPAAKIALRGGGGYKPLLSKKTVERYLPQISANPGLFADAKTFAHMYVKLGKGKRLGNVLVDDKKPAEEDWEVARYAALDELVPVGREGSGAWSEDELWYDGDGEGEERQVTATHLNLIAWAWSPVAERRLVE